jgi:phosphatidylglycerol---prolipoprotein diacylglyceryl transferase
LMLYGSFRFIVEFTREPDAHLGLLGLGLSMGQWLSLPMILIGILLFWHCHGKSSNQ